MNKNKLTLANNILSGCLILFIFSLSSCSVDSGKTTEETTPPEKGKEYVAMTFADLSIKRLPLPIEHEDSLRKAPLTIESYLERKERLDSAYNALQSDTVLPPKTRMERLLEVRQQERVLNDHAFLRSQCGMDDNLVDVERFTGQGAFDVNFTQGKIPAIGLLCWDSSFGNAFSGPKDIEGDVKGRGWGSGCLIAKDLFLTAAHCFNSNPANFTIPHKNELPITPEQSIRFMHVTFNYQWQANSDQIRSDTASYRIAEIKEIRFDGVDYAILRLLPRNGELPGIRFQPLNPAPRNYPVFRGDAICIIQHARGEEKKIGCGQVQLVDGSHIRYGNIDTHSGSSGAPVIDRRTGVIVGVHSDGACDEGGGYNFCSSIQAIRQVSTIIR
ncbi:trypsin-like peptidase domain-containing protein [Pseudoflavitalea sp. X16]|uniref:trypsin-like serine peptidase n=1 Tax=Paraflavitalea devenefica TaxID=2716334 RepID=UPI0014238021|nr:serine protease [Paraflavitalea devenefica]NII25500.1 trypsin-like peptidase domain-containing protein [Paraflavitalea devenefica]